MSAIPGGDDDPSDLRRDGKPALPLLEPEAVLVRLLRLVYPADTVNYYTVEQENLETFVEVYRAAQKYQFLRVQ
jgi:hypothetical protein